MQILEHLMCLGAALEERGLSLNTEVKSENSAAGGCQVTLLLAAKREALS